MKKRIPEYLRLHVEPACEQTPPALAVPAAVAGVLEALSRATGWTFRLGSTAAGREPATLAWSAPVEPAAGTAEQRLELHRSAQSSNRDVPRLELEQTAEIAAALAGLLADYQRTEVALWKREAELATGVPVVARADEQQHLAERLEAILRGGASAVGCHAAALFLLDDATSHLKLRATWGLDRRHLADPPRPLDLALADLEALLGHVVVLDHRAPIPGWRCPEPFSTAVCVPVSTPSIPLGTLWVYSREDRDFSERETNLIEMTAGRLAAELEREMLLSEGLEASRSRRFETEISDWQSQQLPHVAPLMQGWDLAGRTSAPQGPLPCFFDWMLLDDDRLAIVSAAATGDGAAGVMTVAELRGAVRAHLHVDPHPARLLERLNRTLWTMSVGDQQASLFCGVVDLDLGRMQYAAAGAVLGACRKPKRHQRLVCEGPLLGLSCEASYALRRMTLPAGAAVAVAAVCRSQPVRSEMAEVPRLAGRGCTERAERLAQQFLVQARERLESAAPAAVVVLRREIAAS